MTAPAIAVSGLTKTFGDHVAVSDVTFAVSYGSVTGFIGANGSGKTTTMRAILGLVKPSAGTAVIDGVAYEDLIDPRRIVGSVVDRLGGHPGISGTRHLEIVAASAGISRKSIDTALDTVGLADAAGRKLGTYSTGMKQRLALAAALLADPTILLLDEPASGLDPQGIRWLRKLLHERAAMGAAVFVSTHQLAELSTIVDDVVIIDRGIVLAAEPVGELLVRTAATTLEEAVIWVMSQ